MIRRLKKKIILIRKLKRDVLSIYTLKRKIFIIKKFLFNFVKLIRKMKRRYDFYRIGWVPRPIYKKRKTKFGRYFIKRQRFRLFYSFIRIRVFRKIVNKSLRHKNAACLFLYYLESRLDVFLYKINLVPSLRMARQLILHGKVLINNKPRKSYAYNLKKNDCLTFDKKIFYFLKKNIYQNIRIKHLLLNKFPNFIEYDLNNLVFIFTKINLYDVYFFFKNIKIYNFYFLINFYRRCLF